MAGCKLKTLRDLLIVFTLLCCHNQSYAAPYQQHSRELMQTQVMQVVSWLNQLHDTNIKSTKNPEKISKFFNSNFLLKHNSQIVATNPKQFVRSYWLSRKFIVSSKIKTPFTTMIMDGNQLAFHTSTELQKDKHTKENHHVMVMVKFENGKISEWIEVSKKMR